MTFGHVMPLQPVLASLNANDIVKGALHSLNHDDQNDMLHDVLIMCSHWQ